MKQRGFAILIILCFALLPAKVTYGAELNKSEIVLEKEGPTKLCASFQLKTKGMTNVKWSSSNPKVATVSAKGLVKGHEPGQATIEAKAGKTVLSCVVEVVDPQANNLTMYETDVKEIKMKVGVLKDFTVKNTDIAIKKKNNNIWKLLGKTNGETKIIITTKNNNKCTMNVKVVHKYETSSSVEASCLTRGYKIEKCIYCKNKNKVITQQALGHDIVVDRAKDPDCEQGGSRRGVIVRDVKKSLLRRKSYNPLDICLLRIIGPSTLHAHKMGDMNISV